MTRNAPCETHRIRAFFHPIADSLARSLARSCFFLALLRRHEGCELMSRCLAELSRKYVGTKFVKIISTDCIANYPDQLLPTLILYKDGKVQKTLEGLAKFGGKRVSPESKPETDTQRDTERHREREREEEIPIDKSMAAIGVPPPTHAHAHACHYRHPSSLNADHRTPH